MINRILLGKYRLLEDETDDAEDNRGTSLVYRAQDIDSGERVVVELVPVTSLKPAVRTRLESEAVAAKQFDHVNTVRLLDFGVEEDHLVYVTEELQGTALAEWVRVHGPLATGAVLRIAAQLTGALHAAAAHGLLHRTINPDNVMLVPGQTAEGDWPLVKLLHFVGTTPKVSDDDGAVAAFDTSLHYISPEQVRGSKVDLQSEVFSLGATMWFLLTGVPPMVAPKGAKVVVPLMPGGNVSGIPKRVLRLLAQMLFADPDARPNLAELQQRLRDCQLQVDRREAMSRGFGSAAIFQRPRRVPFSGLRLAGTLALTLLLAAMAALAMVTVPKYLKHRRVIRGEEPIGVPIGVANADSAVESPSTQSTAPLTANSLPANNGTVQPTLPPSQSIADASKDVLSSTPSEGNVASVRTENTNSIANDIAQSSPALSAPPSLAPNAQSITEGAIASTGINGSQPQVVDRPNADLSRQSANGTPQSLQEDKIAGHQVRRALPAGPGPNEPQPAAPAEGPPASSSEESTATEQRDSVTQDNTNSVDSSTKRSDAAKPRDSKPTASPRSRESSERKMRHRRRMITQIYPDGSTREIPEPMAPSRRVRGRVVGIAPDGRWLVLLPYSNEVIAVPPPR